jgi:hypothetical protein
VFPGTSCRRGARHPEARAAETAAGYANLRCVDCSTRIGHAIAVNVLFPVPAQNHHQGFLAAAGLTARDMVQASKAASPPFALGQNF